MKKKFALLIFTLAIIFLIPLLYNFFVLDQKDFGIRYTYEYCSDGIYSTYPRGTTDGSSTFYNKDGKEIGICHSWVSGPTCPSEEIQVTCEIKGFTPNPLQNLYILFD